MDRFVVAKRPGPADSGRIWKVQSLLDKFVPQEKGEERKAQVNVNEAVQAIGKAYGRFLADFKILDGKNIWRYPGEPMNAMSSDEYYEPALAHLKGIAYRATDIQIFSFLLADHKQDVCFGTAAGLFLSALINQSAESEFVLNLRDVGKRINCLGFKNNGKKIIINGDVGGLLGAKMQSGHIIVHGAATTGTGFCRENGTIEVNGSLEGVFEDSNHGKIYQNGRLVANGRAIYHERIENECIFHMLDRLEGRT